MEVTLKDGEVCIKCTGLEALKVKSQIASRLGSLLRSRLDCLFFPLSSLPAVSDLIPINSTDEKIRRVLEAFNRHAMARVKAISVIERESLEELPYEWSSILDPAQATAVAAMTVSGIHGLCLFDEQGSGKTVMAIAAFDILKKSKQADALIVVCPKSMVSEWPKDIEKFLPGIYRVMIAEGSKRQKYEAALKEFDILITNYEGVEPMLVTLMASTSKRRYLLIVDESFYVKNKETLRAELAQKLRSVCFRCFVLCGTPAPNSAHDLINQFNLADLGYTFGAFRRTKNPILDWPQIEALINSNGLFVRRLKPEVLAHIPDKQFHVVRVKMEGKQALMYEQARSKLELELRGLNNEKFKKQLATYFQKRAALLQICSTPGSIDPTFADTPAKYFILDTLINKLTTEKRKVILWSFYRKSLDEVEKRYARFNPVRVDGSVPASDRKNAVKRFQEDPTVMLFIGNPAAAGAGITLHASYDAIYLSYSNQAAHYLQSLDRIHRRGQKSSHVNYYLLVCENTIEETEVLRLRGKELSQHRLLGDNILWPTSLDAALSELEQGRQDGHV